MDKERTILIERDDGKRFICGSAYDWRLKKDSLDAFGEVANEITYTDNGNADGGFISSTRLSSVDRTIQLAYIRKDRNDIERRLVTSFFRVANTFKIYVTYNGRTRWADGVIARFAIGTKTDIRDLLEVSVTFTFANPYWKSSDDFGKDISALTPMMAFPYLSQKDVGTTAGRFVFSQELTLENDGDVQSLFVAKITANGACTNPKIIIGDAYVRVIDEMQQGDVITMDFTATPPIIKKNDENFIGHCDRTSDFSGMKLALGNNTIRYEADDGSDNLDVSIYYNKLYLTV